MCSPDPLATLEPSQTPGADGAGHRGSALCSEPRLARTRQSPVERGWIKTASHSSMTCFTMSIGPREVARSWTLTSARRAAGIWSAGNFRAETRFRPAKLHRTHEWVWHGQPHDPRKASDRWPAAFLSGTMGPVCTRRVRWLRESGAGGRVFLGHAGPYPPSGRGCRDPSRLLRRRRSERDLPQSRQPTRRPIEINYDPARTSFRRILEFFFRFMIQQPRTARATTVA